MIASIKRRADRLYGRVAMSSPKTGTLCADSSYRTQDKTATPESESLDPRQRRKAVLKKWKSLNRKQIEDAKFKLNSDINVSFKVTGTKLPDNKQDKPVTDPKKIIEVYQEHKRFTARDKIRPNAKWLGAGIYRDVYEIDGDKVLKIGSKDCNAREAMAWEFASEECRKYLCPVEEVADDYSWIIMQKADIPDDEGEKNQLSGTMNEQTSVAGMNIGDIHRNNVGYIGDDPVVIDYGAFYGFR